MITNAHKGIVLEEDYRDELKVIRNKTIDIAIIAAAILTLPATVFSATRIVFTGHIPIYIIHIILLFLLLCLAIGRKKVPLKVKTHSFLIIYLAYSLMGLSVFELAGAGFFNFVSIVIAVLVLGFRAGITYFAIYILGFYLLGYSFLNELIYSKIDFNTYFDYEISWLVQLLSYLNIGFVLLYVVKLHHDYLTKSVQTAYAANKELNKNRNILQGFMNNYPYPISLVSADNQPYFLNKAYNNLDSKYSLQKETKVYQSPKTFCRTYSGANIENKLFQVIQFESDCQGSSNFQGEIFIDITNQETYKTQLSENEASYKSIVEFNSDGFLLLNEKLQFLEANQSFKSMFNLNEYEISTSKIFDLINVGRSNKKPLEVVKRYIKTKWGKKTVRTIAKKLDGKEFPIEIGFVEAKVEKHKRYWIIVKDLSEALNKDRIIYNAITEAETNERKRFAKDLHDGLNPVFTTSLVYANAIQNTLTDKDTLKFVNRISELLELGLQSVRDISKDLSPQILNDFGLKEALKYIFSRLDNLPGYKIYLNIDIPNNINIHLATSLYRVISELVNNTIKHAKASYIKLELQNTEKELILNYSDNGVGFDITEASKTGLGLKNIEYRLQKIGGVYTVNSKPNKGVQIKAEVPYD